MMKKLWRNFKERISDSWWWFIHRLHPRHRYHMINTGLEPGYYDPEERIKYAAFNLACDYFEDGAPMFDWEATPKEKRTYLLLKQIYEYWRGGGRCELQKRSKELLQQNSEMWWECKCAIVDQDRKHLHMLVDILPSLWYA